MTEFEIPNLNTSISTQFLERYTSDVARFVRCYPKAMELMVEGVALTDVERVLAEPDGDDVAATLEEAIPLLATITRNLVNEVKNL